MSHLQNNINTTVSNSGNDLNVYSLSRRITKCGLLMQGGKVVGVVLWVSGVGNHSYDCAFQRGPLQQPLADQVHVPRRVHIEPDCGARQQHPFMGQQQRETARYLNSAVRGHCPMFPEARTLYIIQLLQTNTYFSYCQSVNI